MKHHNGESGLKMDGADVVETDLNLALGTPSSHDKTVADNTRGVATDDSFSNDAIDYPTSTRLLMINLSLCISIFVTALVSGQTSPVRCLLPSIFVLICTSGR